MAENYLITGYWGEPHVTAENDRGINAAMFGTGRFVLPVGEQFKAEYIGNNTIRMYDGKLMDNGAAAGIPVGEYVDLLIANAGQGKKRNDLIVFQYSQDASTLIESGKFVIVKGQETDGTASDPALTHGDLLSGKTAFDQMALWRVPVSGTTISAPVKLFSVSNDLPGLKAWAEGAFAPAGCGLGEIGGEYVDSINIARNGWFLIRPNTVGGTGQYALVRVDAHDDENVHQTAYSGYATSIGFIVQRRVFWNGVWGEWEYENPPMVVGQEYRTTERYMGQSVYCKMVNFGALPNTSSKTMAHGIENKYLNVRASLSVTGTSAILEYYKGIEKVQANDTNIIITTNADLSEYTAVYVTLWYTKG